MILKETLDGNIWTLFLTGTLTPDTSHELETHIRASITGVEHLILDCSGLSMISAAGLRTLLILELMMSAGGGRFEVRNCNTRIQDFFRNTGFHQFAACGG